MFFCVVYTRKIYPQALLNTISGLTWAVSSKQNAIEQNCVNCHHPAHEQCIIWAFALYSLYILQYPMILLVDSEGPAQTVGMCRLIWTFAFCICQKTPFRTWHDPHSFWTSSLHTP